MKSTENFPSLRTKRLQTKLVRFFCNLLKHKNPAAIPVAKAASTPNVVKAQKFQLIDDNDRIRAEVAVNEAGAPSFILYDKDGQTRLAVELDEYGEPGLYLKDNRGVPRISLGRCTIQPPPERMIFFRPPGLYLIDENAQIRVGAYEFGRAALYLDDEDGVGRISAVADRSGANLSLSHPDQNDPLGNRERIVANVDENGEPILYITDHNKETYLTVGQIKKNQNPIKRFMNW